MGIYSFGVRWQQIDQCGKPDSTKIPLGVCFNHFCRNWWSFIVGFATLLAASPPNYIYIYVHICTYIYMISDVNIYHIYIYILSTSARETLFQELLDLHSCFLGAVRGITPLLTSLSATVYSAEAHWPIESW